MHNKNTIDEIVRNAVQDGQERLNLGSWANMERMLDGQNPYTQPEEEKKKRGFWLFGAVLAGLLLVGTAAYLFLHPSSASTTIAANADKVVVVKPVVTDANNEIMQNDGDNNIQNNARIINKNLADDTKVINKNASIAKNKIEKNIVATTNNNQDLNNNSVVASSIIETKDDAQSIPGSEEIVVNKFEQNNKKTSNKILTKSNDSNALDNAIVALNNTEISAKESKLNNASETPKSKNILQKIFSKKQKPQSTITNYTTPETSNVGVVKVKKPIQKNQNDSVTAVSVKYKKRKTDDGIITTKEVTVSKSKNVVKIEQPIAEPQELFTPDGSVHPQNYNPRLLVLSPEDDLKASAKPTAVKRHKSETASIKQIEDNIAPIATKPIVTTLPKTNKTNNSRESAAIKAIEKIKEAATKFGYLGIFNKKMEVNPGVFAGINGSFFNAKHNFGGFQAGSNLMIKMTENFSVIPHLGFYYRNNGGYSVKDYTTTVYNKSTAISTDLQYKIYNYTTDSMQLSYNFKHVYNVEAPIILNYAKRDFGFYGGVHLSYGLQMNPTNTSKVYTKQNQITVPIAAPSVEFPGNQSSFYKSTDFQSRFGVGYVLGASYDFHPNLYIDFRMTQVLKDNSGTASAIEMSKQFFRVPSMQIGIGYRFKEKERVRFK
jgi:hypothetical protein